MARKRRSRWPSRSAAVHSLGSKPPFSKWDPASLEAYIKHGLRPVGAAAGSSNGGATTASYSFNQGAGSAGGAGDAQQAAARGPSNAGGGSSAQPGLGPQAGKDEECEVELCCSPATEEAVYLACEPPFTLWSPGRIQCPVLLSVGGSEGSGDVHSRLPLLGCDAAQELPNCQFVR